jgi:hypothetical protein
MFTKLNNALDSAMNLTMRAGTEGAPKAVNAGISAFTGSAMTGVCGFGTAKAAEKTYEFYQDLVSAGPVKTTSMQFANKVLGGFGEFVTVVGAAAGTALLGYTTAKVGLKTIDSVVAQVKAI